LFFLCIIPNLATNPRLRSGHFYFYVDSFCITTFVIEFVTKHLKKVMCNLFFLVSLNYVQCFSLAWKALKKIIKKMCALCKHLKWFVNFCNGQNLGCLKFFVTMHFCELLQWIYHVLRILVWMHVSNEDEFLWTFAIDRICNAFVFSCDSTMTRIERCL